MVGKQQVRVHRGKRRVFSVTSWKHTECESKAPSQLRFAVTTVLGGPFSR